MYTLTHENRCTHMHIHACIYINSYMMHTHCMLEITFVQEGSMCVCAYDHVCIGVGVCMCTCIHMCPTAVLMF